MYMSSFYIWAWSECTHLDVPQNVNSLCYIIFLYYFVNVVENMFVVFKTSVFHSQQQLKWERNYLGAFTTL